MATRAFADLSTSRQLAAQPTMNPLDALLQGFQQGVQIRQLPQTLQSNQLAQQLQNAINLQKLQDLQNPEQAILRDIERQLTIKSALNPELGIVSAQPGLVGETIFNPSALTVEQQASLPTPAIQAARQLAFDQAGIPIPKTVIPTATPGLPETPVSAFGIQTGLNVNPNIPEQAQEDKLNRQIQLANARVKSAGVQGQFIPDGFGGMIFAQKPTVSGGEIQTTRVTTPEGTPVKVAPKTGRGSSLTPNAQTTLLAQASAAGIDPDSEKYFNKESGTYDFTKLAIDKGRATRENKRLENAAKASVLTGKTKTDVDALNAAEKQLDLLQDEISDIAKSGKTPGFLDNLIAAETAAPPSGWLSSGWQQLLKDIQSDESKELELKKTIISSALTKAISGLAVTQQEATRLGFLPRAGESFEEIVRKSALLKEYINNQRAGLSQGTAGASTTPASTGNAPVRVNSKAERDALAPGTVYVSPSGAISTR